MKKILITLQILLACFLIQAQKLVNINPDPNGEPWLVGGFRELTPEEISKIPELVLPSMAGPVALPYRVSNATSPYFRSIIMQQGGSCGQASGIAYAYTYEVNFMRGIPSKDSANLYPSHFTYNFLNSGDDTKGSNYTDGWQIIKECGVPSILDYGGLYPMEDTGWMSGYDKYRRAMGNRVLTYYKIDIGTPAGLQNLKRWIYDHGNGSAYGGVACFSAGIASAVMRRVDLGIYESRKRIMKSWSDPVDHAMTFIGYDDSVRYDFNGDKKYTNDIDLNGDSIIDMRDWEIGAMIIANSWSENWGDSGFIYTPYRNLALKVSEGGISGSRAYVVVPQPVYQPEMTMKIKLAHEKRDKLSIRAGVSEYINAGKPDFLMSIMAFDQKGGPYSMQGINNDPIELTLDISPLLHVTGIQPVKIFLKISEDDGDTVANGMLYNMSVTDHRTGEKEYISGDSSQDIVNNGNTYASVVLDYPGAPPENLSAIPMMKGFLLTWDRPSDTNGLTGYHLFRDGEFYASTADTCFPDYFVPNGTTYKVKAVFKTGISTPSNTILVSSPLHLPVTSSGYTLKYDGLDDCVNCGKGVNIANHDFTIEFWARRLPNTGNCFVIGHGTYNKGEYGLHIGFRDNRMYFGFWGDDVQTKKEYTDSAWHHWAVTYDTTTKKQTIYRDGIKENDREAKEHYKGASTLYIGCMKGSTWFYNGELDEVRVWNYVRSVRQIDSFRYFPLSGIDTGLLGYWRFDERSGDTLYDHSFGGHNGILKNFNDYSWSGSTAWADRNVKSLDDTIFVFGGYSKYSHPVKIEILVPPVYGNIVVDTPAMKLIYRPVQEFYSEDSFLYLIWDDTLFSYTTIYIHPSFPVGVKEIPVFGGVLYPNSAKDFIYLLPGKPIKGYVKVEINDLFGRKIMSKEFNFMKPVTELPAVDIGKLPEGVYMFHISSDDLDLTIRFLKAGK